ncbi:MAG: hydrolase, partial [Proteobacteria bacterium]|nr:hydrolase [Pseudomonadota bacterium]
KMDILLTKALIEQLVKENNIDRKRIYATGLLNGALFTLRLACDMADELVAFAPVMASMPADYIGQCRPAKRVPIIIINGTNDKMIPWNGGTSPFGGSFSSGGKLVSVEKTVEFWREHNDCSPSAYTAALPDLDKKDGTRVRVAEYKNCYKGSALRHVTIENGGSAWPGSPEKPGLMRTNVIGLTSYDINASEMIWKFFKENTPK